MEGLESFYTSGQQLWLFALSCLFGIPTGMMFDIFRALRSVIPHGKAAVLIEDILFFVLYGVFILSFTSAFAKGEFRFYYPLGNFLGAVLYFFTLGSIIIGIFRKAAAFLKKVISKPVKKFALICGNIFGKIVIYLQNISFKKKTSQIPLIDNDDLLYNNSTDKNRTKEQKKEREKIVDKKAKKG